VRRGLRLVGALVLPLALVACGGGGGGGQTPGDGGTDVAFMGTATSGKIPKGPALDAEVITYTPINPDALLACCPTVLTLADPTGDEAWARIKGDLAPLEGDGVAATWADGVWSATVCLQAGLVTKYHFELPAAPADAGTEAVDAGAAVERRVSPEQPIGYDDDANEVNEVILDEACGTPGDGEADGGIS